MASPTVNDLGIVSRNTWLACLAEARSLGIASLQIIGGEPTIHPALLLLIKRARAYGFENIELFSNATHLTKKVLKIMRQNGVALATSLYGANVDEHDHFTTVKGSFSRTCRNIEHAVSLGIKVRVAVVRYQHEGPIVERTRDVALRLGVGDVSTDVVRAFGRGRDADTWERGCEGCGISVLRVCSDGVISGCSMDRQPELGHVTTGLTAALRNLRNRQRSYDQVS
jgi:MoaA/NifB/PqqE/SkfB family radical SAM enzyme